MACALLVEKKISPLLQRPSFFLLFSPSPCLPEAGLTLKVSLAANLQLSRLYLPRSRITGLHGHVSWNWNGWGVLWISSGGGDTIHESAPPSGPGMGDAARLRKDNLVALQMRVRAVAWMLSARAPLAYSINSTLCGDREMQAAGRCVLFGGLQIFEANIGRFFSCLWERRMYV